MVAVTQQNYADPEEYVLGVSFMKVGKIHYFEYEDFPDLALGDFVLVQTDKLGMQMGEIKAFYERKELDSRDISYIQRPATPADLLLSQQWKEQEVAALIECREQAAEIGGFKDVKFVAAEYNFDGSVLTYFYSTEEQERIKTHRLRAAMQQIRNTRVEFRQIGPRDVAKMLGGFGACGIPRCCSTFLTDFSMISINMAKAQGISLNPTEITGMCGRLRCCLIYEYEQYVEARKQLPKMRKRVGTPHGQGRVIEVLPLRDGVTVEVDDTRHFVSREEIIPIAEWEALRDAAASPCAKDTSGGCDCGAKRPRDEEESSEVRSVVVVSEEGDVISDKSEGEAKGRRRSRKRRPRGNRRRGKGKNPKQE